MCHPLFHLTVHKPDHQGSQCTSTGAGRDHLLNREPCDGAGDTERLAKKLRSFSNPHTHQAAMGTGTGGSGSLGSSGFGRLSCGREDNKVRTELGSFSRHGIKRGTRTTS